MGYEDVLREQLGTDGFTTEQFRDNRRLHVTPAQLFELLRSLKEEYGYDMLAELTAVDYLKYPDATDRFGVIYVLLNTATGQRVIVNGLQMVRPGITVEPKLVAMPTLALRSSRQGAGEPPAAAVAARTR